MAQFQQNTQAQVMTKLTGIVGVACIIKLKDLGEIRGVIEEIVAPVFAEDIQRSIDLTEFKVRLESGDALMVPGSAFSKTGYAVA